MVLYGIIIFQVLLIISLVRGIQLSLRARGRIEGLEKKKEELEQEEKGLKAQEEYVQSPYYLEKVAREELHLAKPGETVVIVPEGNILYSVRSEQEEAKEKPNWQKWGDILSGRIN